MAMPQIRVGHGVYRKAKTLEAPFSAQNGGFDVSVYSSKP